MVKKRECNFLHMTYKYLLGLLKEKVFATMKIQSGETVGMTFNLDKMHIFDFKTVKHI